MSAFLGLVTPEKSSKDNLDIVTKCFLAAADNRKARDSIYFAVSSARIVSQSKELVPVEARASTG